VFAGFREASNESIEKVPISKVGHTIGFRFRRRTGKNLKKAVDPAPLVPLLTLLYLLIFA
jgi:hypothetical protein